MKAWLFLFCGLVAVGASGQSYQRQEQQVSRSRDLTDDLTANQLTDRQLSAFSRRAEQKLLDFYGYMGYQANAQYSAMNSVSDTRQRSLDLFQDTTTLVAPLFYVGDPAPILAFLDSVESTFGSVEIQVDSLVWAQPLALAPGESVYAGTLTYLLHAQGFQASAPVTDRLGMQRAEVYLQQVEKSFGRRGSNLVWEVRLGSILWVEE
ncbi:MAG: hypothetical protein AAFQ98_18275 [Bacteroidota bacterium]